MRKRGYLIASLAILLLLVLSGCKGNKLPDGMDEDEVARAGLSVMSQLTKGEYEEVHDALREDVRAQTSAEAIETMMDTATEGRGHFKKVKDSMVTGVTDTEEVHGIAGYPRKVRRKIRDLPHRLRPGDEPHRTGRERK
ncbi:MAG: hypothetical protein ACLUN5_12865 [Oscillospiraceae bacterium]